MQTVPHQPVSRNPLRRFFREDRASDVTDPRAAWRTVILAGMSPNGQVRQSQLEVLGLSHPLTKGWMDRFLDSNPPIDRVRMDLYLARGGRQKRRRRMDK